MQLNSKKQRGVGLIEVLVTLLVLAVGLLGLAGLQNSALKFNHTAYLESQAQFLIRDIIESMRSSGAPQGYVINFGEPAPDGPNCKTTDCSTAKNLADWTIEEWISSVHALLPHSDVQIKMMDAVTNEFEIRIRYDDQRGESQDASQPVDHREVRVSTRI